jgi:hypothetical protein
MSSISTLIEASSSAARRSDALEKRRKLMEAWAAYCERASDDGDPPQVLQREKELPGPRDRDL